MILVDTNVLVALVDEGDALHTRATRDLKRLRRGPFGVMSVVLGEACFLLPLLHSRLRLRFLLDHLRSFSVELSIPWWNEVFDWLAIYADHEPDLADAALLHLSGSIPGASIWTYDREFATTWRHKDGTPPRLALGPGPALGRRR